MAVPDTSKRLDDAKVLVKSKPSDAEAIYKDILSNGPGTTDASQKDYENALMGLGEAYRDQKKVTDLSELVRATRDELSNMPKAKTAKIGMSFHHVYSNIFPSNSTPLQSVNC